MLGKFLSKPIRLEIGDQRLVFDTFKEFDFALSARAALPLERIDELTKMAVRDLLAENRAVEELKGKLIAVLATSSEKSGGIRLILQQMDPQTFTNDHRWRDIFIAINRAPFEGQDSTDTMIRRAVLTRYVQYLSSRQKFVRYLRGMQGKILAQSKPAIKVKPPAAKYTAPGRDDDLSEHTTMSMTAYDRAKEQRKDGFERIPKGEVSNLHIEPNSEIEILLSKSKCKLKRTDKILFVDNNGQETPLETGHNTIGRDSGLSNITMDASLRDISRLHIVIDVDKTDIGVLRLTDLSSHGCFLPAEHLTGSMSKTD